MKRPAPCWISWFTTGFLALGLTLCPRVHAQEGVGGGVVESKGRPYDGYLGTIALCALTLFVVGKSARR
jgi:hypothetical protein